MPAPKGNNYNTKWKTSKERQKACGKVCDHLLNGLSQDCFPDADWDTVERYMKDFPEDFPSEKIAAAKRKGRYFWESLGRQGALGKLAGFNPASWIFNMKNRYGWRDKLDHTTDGKPISMPILDIERDI